MFLLLPFFAAVSLAMPRAAPKPAPYRISVDPNLIGEAAVKARLYRPSVDLEDGTSDTWVEGPPADNMTALAKYWANEYNWSEVEEELNGNGEHFTVTVPAGQGYDQPVSLHFIHDKSERSDAIPVLLLHGWPSSHLEWIPILKPLTSPEDPNAPAFHVVVPDVPGFGFSPAATHDGFGPRQAGAAFANLMQTLGYDKYGVISTDAGWWTALWMAGDDKGHLVGHFTDYYFAQPTAADIERFNNNKTDEVETKYIVSLQETSNRLSAYQTIQKQGPLKLGQAMNDSPVGFAGWIWQLIYFASDGYRYTLKEVVTRTMLLWIPGAYGNLRTYLEWFSPESNAFPSSEIPTGVSQWGSANGPSPELRDYPLAPASWIERLSNLTFIVTREFGGHFPAEQYPDLYVKDVRDFFSQL